MSAPQAGTDPTRFDYVKDFEVPLCGELGPRVTELGVQVLMGPFTPPHDPDIKLPVRIRRITALVRGKLRVLDLPYRRPMSVTRENILRIVREPLTSMIRFLELEVAENRAARDNAPQLVAKLVGAFTKGIGFNATDRDVVDSAARLDFMPAT